MSKLTVKICFLSFFLVSFFISGCGSDSFNPLTSDSLNLNLGSNGYEKSRLVNYSNNTYVLEKSGLDKKISLFLNMDTSTVIPKASVLSSDSMEEDNTHFFCDYHYGEEDNLIVQESHYSYLGDSVETELAILDTKDTFFYAKKPGYRYIMKLGSENVYDSEEVSIFLEKGVKTNVDWSKIGKNIDTHVISKLNAIFGRPVDIDQDGKVTILFLNIDYSEDFQGNISGYIRTTDFIPNIVGANHKDMVYLNSELLTTFDDGNIDDLNSLLYRVLAHEYHHLITLSHRILSKKITKPMDTWLLEGLANCAARLVGDKPLRGVKILLGDERKFLKLSSGLSMFQWKGYPEQYALSYLFLSYLWVQSGKTYEDFISELSNLSISSYLDLFVAIKKDNPELFKIPSDLLLNFWLGLFLNQKTGLYGFKDQHDFVGLNHIYGKISLSEDHKLDSIGNGGALLTVPFNADLNLSHSSIIHVVFE